jgi:hypothetical protein
MQKKRLEFLVIIRHPHMAVQIQVMSEGNANHVVEVHGTMIILIKPNQNLILDLDMIAASRVVDRETLPAEKACSLFCLRVAAFCEELHLVSTGHWYLEGDSPERD